MRFQEALTHFDGCMSNMETGFKNILDRIKLPA